VAREGRRGDHDDKRDSYKKFHADGLSGVGLLWRTQPPRFLEAAIHNKGRLFQTEMKDKKLPTKGLLYFMLTGD
jgi:hypothetical protein